VQPVAQGGIDANIGAKKMDKRKQIPVVRAVSPVFPPSVIPAPDSMKAVTGDVPKRAPMDIEKASVQYAIVDRGKAPVSSSTTPANLAMLPNVRESNQTN
jgi:hypothetical protein